MKDEESTALLNLDPGPSKVLAPGHNYDTVTNKISGVILRPLGETPRQLFIGFAVLLLTPSPLNRLIFSAAGGLAVRAGVPGQAIYDGFHAFRFWTA